MISKKKMCCFVKTIHITWGKKICHLRDEKLKIQRGRENRLVETNTGSDGMEGLRSQASGPQELGLNSGSAFN